MVYCSGVKSSPTLLTESKTMTFAHYRLVSLQQQTTRAHSHDTAGGVKLFTHHVFDPVRVKVRLEALYFALVSMLPGSLPWFGSVRPKQPKISPCAAVINTTGHNNAQSRICSFFNFTTQIHINPTFDISTKTLDTNITCSEKHKTCIITGNNTFKN